jgi:hypothetical protein
MSEMKNRYPGKSLRMRTRGAKEYGKVQLTCLSFGTTREGFPSKVTSKLIKMPMKMGAKMN